MSAFSIIIPIFNAEKTVARCLDAVLRQGFCDFEVLMIENGSSDASADICRQYAEADNRFHLYTCVQKGPSAARNMGLSRAKGTYIAFVDSDDYVAPDYLEQLYQTFQSSNADVVFFGCEERSEAGALGAVRVPEIPDNLSGVEILTELCNQDMFGYTWIKAFRLSAIGETQFSLELDLLEDEVFACQVLAKGCSVAILPKAIYTYVTGNGTSLMGKTRRDYCSILDRAYTGWESLLEGKPEGQPWLIQRANQCVENCMYYGFEREIDPEYFFISLQQTRFFEVADLDCGFYDAVQSGDIRKLKWMRMKYRLKVALSKMLRR